MKEQNPALPLDEKVKQMLLTGDGGNYSYMEAVLKKIAEDLMSTERLQNKAKCLQDLKRKNE